MQTNIIFLYLKKKTSKPKCNFIEIDKNTGAHTRHQTTVSQLKCSCHIVVTNGDVRGRGYEVISCSWRPNFVHNTICI